MGSRPKPAVKKSHVFSCFPNKLSSHNKSKLNRHEFSSSSVQNQEHASPLLMEHSSFPENTYSVTENGTAVYSGSVYLNSPPYHNFIVPSNPSADTMSVLHAVPLPPSHAMTKCSATTTHHSDQHPLLVSLSIDNLSLRSENDPPFLVKSGVIAPRKDDIAVPMLRPRPFKPKEHRAHEMQATSRSLHDIRFQHQYHLPDENDDGDDNPKLHLAASPHTPPSHSIHHMRSNTFTDSSVDCVIDCDTVPARVSSPARKDPWQRTPQTQPSETGPPPPVPPHRGGVIIGHGGAASSESPSSSATLSICRHSEEAPSLCSEHVPQQHSPIQNASLPSHNNSTSIVNLNVTFSTAELALVESPVETGTTRTLPLHPAKSLGQLPASFPQQRTFEDMCNSSSCSSRSNTITRSRRTQQPASTFAEGAAEWNSSDNTDTKNVAELKALLKKREWEVSYLRYHMQKSVAALTKALQDCKSQWMAEVQHERQHSQHLQHSLDAAHEMLNKVSSLHPSAQHFPMTTSGTEDSGFLPTCSQVSSSCAAAASLSSSSIGSVRSSGLGPALLLSPDHSTHPSSSGLGWENQADDKATNNRLPLASGGAGGLVTASSSNHKAVQVESSSSASHDSAWQEEMHRLQSQLHEQATQTACERVQWLQEKSNVLQYQRQLQETCQHLTAQCHYLQAQLASLLNNNNNNNHTNQGPPMMMEIQEITSPAIGRTVTRNKLERKSTFSGETSCETQNSPWRRAAVVQYRNSVCQGPAPGMAAMSMVFPSPQQGSISVYYARPPSSLMSSSGSGSGALVASITTSNPTTGAKVTPLSPMTQHAPHHPGASPLSNVSRDRVLIEESLC